MKKRFYFVISLIVLCCLAVLLPNIFAKQSNKQVYAYTTKSYSNDYTGMELPSAYYMRDDYMIFAQTQSVQGLCWEYASSMALSTTLMKATGEY